MRYLIIILALLSAGCIPSLCLFNCGDTIHKDTDAGTIIQHGIRWNCVISSADDLQGEGVHLRKATCYGKKEAP